MEKTQKTTKTTTTKASKSSKTTPKTAAKPEPKQEVTYAPEPPKEPLYTRIMAVTQVIKENPGIKKDVCIEKADALYKEKTGYHANPKETAFNYRYAVNVLKTWGAI